MSKGAKRERQAQSIYRDAGYATYRPATVTYGENDVFGLFDLLAIHPDGTLRFIQVKSNGASGIRTFNRLAWFFKAVGPDVHVEYAVPHDREGWRLVQCHSTGHETVYDGRESEENMGDGLTAYLSH